jgi:uncharacterized membrane protein YdjX (TVP38/TMEM64 family)
MTNAVRIKMKWQLIPIIIFIAVMVGWLVLEVSGAISLEHFVQGLSREELLVSAILIVLLLAVDLFVPIPSTLVMPLAGHMFGVLPGTVLVTTGSMLLSVMGYFIGKTGRHLLIQKVISLKEVEKMDQWMKQYGKWPLLLSKALAMMAETVSVTCGIARMSFVPYLLLSFAGTLPVCFLYVFAGNQAENIEEIFIIAVGGFLLALLLLFTARCISRKRKTKKIPAKN